MQELYVKKNVNHVSSLQSLKIRPSAIRPIDIVLRRSAEPDLCRPPVEDAACGDDILTPVPCKLFLSPLKKRVLAGHQ